MKISNFITVATLFCAALLQFEDVVTLKDILFTLIIIGGGIWSGVEKLSEQKRDGN